jgi:hypothetical protein
VAAGYSEPASGQFDIAGVGLERDRLLLRAAMMFTMEPGSWDEIDEMIVTRRILPAMQAIRELAACSLPQAIELFSDRYTLLRERRPHDFTVGPEQYGHGVYT